MVRIRLDNHLFEHGTRQLHNPPEMQVGWWISEDFGQRIFIPSEVLHLFINAVTK